MRVALTKGRIDPEAEATFAQGLTRKPPYYFFSQIIRDLEPACLARGWAVDILSVGKPTPQNLRRPDVVVNLITEPLVCGRALDRLENMVQTRRIPVLNEVEAIRRSARTELHGVLRRANAARAGAPLTTRFSRKRADLEAHIEKAGHRWPVLLRPTGTHSSKGLAKVDDAPGLRALGAIPSDLLVSDFVDFRSGDGLYRKYRMIWANASIFRRHVIASLDWNVTGKSRVDMVERPHTIAAEKKFLESGGELDERVAELFRIVGLDFGVIDFALGDTGEITVFELNGTFQVSRSIPAQSKLDWRYLEAGNSEILDALVASIAHRAA